VFALSVLVNLPIMFVLLEVLFFFSSLDFVLLE